MRYLILALISIGNPPLLSFEEKRQCALGRLCITYPSKLFETLPQCARDSLITLEEGVASPAPPSQLHFTWLYNVRCPQSGLGTYLCSYNLLYSVGL